MAEHPVGTMGAVPTDQEEPHPVQPIDSDRESALEDRVLDLPRAREVDPVQHHWGELRASEDHYCAGAHGEAAASCECYAADRPDWPNTPGSGATLHGRTCIRSPCPCSESPESFG